MTSIQPLRNSGPRALCRTSRRPWLPQKDISKHLCVDVFHTEGKEKVSSVTCSSIFMFVTRRLWSVLGPRLIFLWELKNQTRNSLDNWRVPLPPPATKRGMIICLDVHIPWVQQLPAPPQLRGTGMGGKGSPQLRGCIRTVRPYTRNLQVPNQALTSPACRWGRRAPATHPRPALSTHSLA